MVRTEFTRLLMPIARSHSGFLGIAGRQWGKRQGAGLGREGRSIRLRARSPQIPIVLSFIETANPIAQPLQKRRLPADNAGSSGNL